MDVDMYEEEIPSYSPDTHGDLIAYLVEQENSFAQNKFKSLKYFEEIFRKGLTIPEFSQLRISDSQIPDLSLTVLPDGTLQSPGADEDNMSVVPAPKGIYEASEILNGRLWSVFGLNLRSPQYQFAFGLRAHHDIGMAINKDEYNIGYNCIESIPLAFNEIFKKFSGSSIFSRIINPFPEYTYKEDSDFESQLDRIVNPFDSGFGEVINFQSTLASLGFSDGFGRTRFSFDTKPYELLWKTTNREYADEQEIVSLNLGQMVDFLEHYFAFIEREPRLEKFKGHINHMYELFEKQ